MSKFKIEITSVPDREQLVAEIWHSEFLIAEINREKEALEIELYPVKKMAFEFEEFLEILETARERLREK